MKLKGETEGEREKEISERKRETSDTSERQILCTEIDFRESCPAWFLGQLSCGRGPGVLPGFWGRDPAGLRKGN